MSALAVKVESVTQLAPRQLTLRDRSCKPKFSNDRFAYFTFDASSCGTTRTVRLCWFGLRSHVDVSLTDLSFHQLYDGVMMYQNEIASSAPVYQQSKKGVPTPPPDPEYR